MASSVYRFKDTEVDTVLDVLRCGFSCNKKKHEKMEDIMKGYHKTRIVGSLVCSMSELDRFLGTWIKHAQLEPINDICSTYNSI